MFHSVRIAKLALRGVGDPLLGEWVTRGHDGIYHVRRRLTGGEQAVVGEARDIRGTADERVRLVRLFAEVSPAVRDALLRVAPPPRATAPRET